jgi:dienelactone hydrolase
MKNLRSRPLWPGLFWGLLLAFGCPLLAAAAEPLRVLPAGELPHDQRLGDLKTLNDYFPFHPCDSPEAWATRAERVRRQVLVATGLWPMPTATPAGAVVHGKVDRGEYTVERVYFESFPGHFVTGSLYRPKGFDGPRPGVLCPHGHWANGRFYDAGEKAVRQSIVDGAERFELSGRFPLQARCVQLARMGCVVFHYDMIGYADSQQISHRPGLREKMNTPEQWGYFSPQAEARMQNMMGLQTYNSVRALDWLTSLPDVDPKRIGVTGASGGGTQTFILAAIDPRPAVAFPAVMVSTAMQGGCTCENACYLRVGTGNVEIAALFSPRPLGMTAADDWTKEIATKGLPDLKEHYKMLGVEDRVMARPLVQFPHNYNYVSRAVMYPWMNKHLKLGQKEPIVEGDFKPLSVEEMTVWDDEHPKPPAGDEYERSLLEWITKDSEKQMAALLPKDADTLAEFRRVVGGAVDVMIGRGLPAAEAVAMVHGDLDVLGEYATLGVRIQHTEHGEDVPAIFLSPLKSPPSSSLAIWVSPEGKQGVLDGQGNIRPAVRRLNAKVVVVAIDLFGQGEFTGDGKPLAKQRLSASGRGDWASYAGYTYGYNDPLFSQRVHDILTAVAAVKKDGGFKSVYLVGLSGAGHWVAAARAQAGEAVTKAVVDTGGLRFANVAAIDDADFLPGGAKYHDLPGMLALSAPHALWLTGEGAKTPEVVAAAYQASGHADQLTVFDHEQGDPETAAVEWLLK